MPQIRHRTHPLFERVPLVHGQAVGLRDNRHDIHDLTQLLHDDDVDGTKGVASRVDEEQTAVDARVLDVAVADGGELLAEVRAVLVLDVLDNWVPASNECQRNSCFVGEKGMKRTSFRC